MPQSTQEMPSALHGNDNHLYCLLEDDSLVTKVTIDTQRLNTPKSAGESIDYAELLVKASIKMLRPHNATKGFV
jgi:hypothetical protein